MKALLIIDLQKYLINENTESLPTKIANFIEKHKFDYTLFFQFYNSPNSNFVKIHNWNHMFGPPETDMVDELSKYITRNNLFKKYSFSVFGVEGFNEFMKSNLINELYLCGIDTDACVLLSEMEAFGKGYDAKVIEDLCASHWGIEYHRRAIDLIKRNLGKQAIIKSNYFRPK
ncbi:MAG: Isochorismatase hydrolase family protein [Microgenomates group bacterium GW2011_GWA2_47_8]|nr:MAG: Isochorismatase hydrolase family protein [Microgenomates group bacterium GW2011_GWA2_47_8]